MIYFFILLLFLSALYATFIVWCWFGWRKLREYIPEEREFRTRVSVVIPVRNEEKNVEACLLSVIRQQYPVAQVEIIVSDDHSDDGTEEIVQTIIQKFPSHRILFLRNDIRMSGTFFKKQAITSAIEQASGELIVTTDADCTMSEQWLSAIVSHYEKEHPAMIAGPVCIHNENNAVEKFQALEFAGLIAIGAGAISNGRPVMCNGANLAYTKKVFREVNGFAGLHGTPSGDDTQLMEKIARNDPQRIHFLKSREAIVFTPAVSSIHALVQQRKRWASKIPGQMSVITLLVASIAWLLHTGLIIIFFKVFFDPSWLFMTALVLLIKIIPELLLLASILSFFDRRKLIWLFVPAQLIYPFYIFFVGVLSPFGSYRWKGRKIKSPGTRITIG